MRKNRLLGLVMCAAMAVVPFGAAAADTDAPILGMQQITVNGEAVDFTKSNLSQYIYDENGVVMVPLRAVAEKMGFTVEWNGENRSVSVEDKDWKTLLYIGEDSYVGVTKIEGAVGMTAPQSYSAAPTLIENTTFVPAKMFELMYYSVRSIGQFVDFSNTDGNDAEYSRDTLIVTVSADADRAAVLKLFEENNLEVVYELKTMNIYTVRLEKKASDEELAAYIERLEKNENVLSVSKDYIMQID